MKDDKIEDLFKSIPRSPEDMAQLQDKILNHESAEVVAKAHAHNKRIQSAKEMLKMFESDTFKRFWRIVHDEMIVATDGSVRSIVGNKQQGLMYDPLGQIAQLNNIQGGLELLDSQTMQMEIWVKTAEGDEIDVEELQSKFNQMREEAKSN